MKDFGRIAVSARINQPDPCFVQSWTHLCAGNVLARGDRIITPVIELPHHWAACVVADRFMASDCDTLLMIDDDMVFDAEQIVDLRDEPQNWECGMVQALCPSRQPPHLPVVLVDADDGERYRGATAIPEGAGTIEVGLVGLAFTLIRREVIEAVQGMLAHDELLFNWGIEGRGEDCTFCRRAKAAGFRLGVDTRVSIGHRFPVEVRYDRDQNKPMFVSNPNLAFRRLLNNKGTRQEVEHGGA